MRPFSWKITLAAVVWALLNGLVVAGQSITVQHFRGRDPEVLTVLRDQLVGAALWVPCVLWLLWWTARHPVERERWLAPLGWLLFAIVVVVVFRGATFRWLDPWMGWYHVTPSWSEVLIGSTFKNFLLCGMIVGVGHALVYAQRSRVREQQARDLQQRLTQARLDALSSQLNPHFLFNALNTISEMVHHDPEAADRVVVQLGMLLRYSLESSREQQTSLENELDAVDAYISIQQVRLGDRLVFRRHVDPSARFAQVPRLMLQPLVENAVSHAVARRASPGTVEVRAACDADRLVLDVVDDGGDAPAAPGFGVGLANTRERLECLYGDAQSLEIVTTPGAGTRVRITLPLRRGDAG